MAPLIVDTSALLAFFDSSEPDHAAVSEVLDQAHEQLVISPYVVAELDHLTATRHGVDAELAVLTELAGGAWQLAHMTERDLERARSVVADYRDQEVGVAAASNVVLAERYRTTAIVTLDHRHFSVLRPLSGGHFSLLP